MTCKVDMYWMSGKHYNEYFKFEFNNHCRYMKNNSERRQLSAYSINKVHFMIIL